MADSIQLATGPFIAAVEVAGFGVKGAFCAFLGC